MTAVGARALVFFTSASVLVIEILAVRLMAPYVGVTLEAFTAIIGTVLAAIALGNWWGGRAADRGEPRRLLGPLLVGGGVLTLVAPLVVTTVGPTFRGSQPIQIVVLAALAFLAPAVVLSAVSPIVVKLRLGNLGQTGSVVGRLSAVGTAGALFGTFVTGFFLLASFPTRPIIVGLGGLLVVVGIGVRAANRRGHSSAIGVVAVLLGTATLNLAGPCDVETSYSCVIVETDPGRENGRTLWLDTSKHSYVDVIDPTHLEFRYVNVVADVIRSTGLPDSPAVLSVGGGGFTLPRWIRAEYGHATQTVLELDSRLVDLAYEQLGLQVGDVDEVVIGDARLSVRNISTPIDLVLADAFGGFVVPWHLTTREFFTDVARPMTPDGVFIMNVIDYPPRDFVRAEVATLREVFDHVLVIAPEVYFAGNRGGNFVVVGSFTPLDQASIEQAIAERHGIEQILTGQELVEWIDSADILTDDFAPVDQLITR